MAFYSPLNEARRLSWTRDIFDQLEQVIALGAREVSCSRLGASESCHVGGPLGMKWGGSRTYKADVAAAWLSCMRIEAGHGIVGCK